MIEKTAMFLELLATSRGSRVHSCIAYKSLCVHGCRRRGQWICIHAHHLGSSQWICVLHARCCWTVLIYGEMRSNHSYSAQNDLRDSAVLPLYSWRNPYFLQSKITKFGLLYTVGHAFPTGKRFQYTSLLTFDILC